MHPLLFGLAQGTGMFVGIVGASKIERAINNSHFFGKPTVEAVLVRDKAVADPQPLVGEPQSMEQAMVGAFFLSDMSAPAQDAAAIQPEAEAAAPETEGDAVTTTFFNPIFWLNAVEEEPKIIAHLVAEPAQTQQVAQVQDIVIVAGPASQPAAAAPVSSFTVIEAKTDAPVGMSVELNRQAMAFFNMKFANITTVITLAGDFLNDEDMAQLVDDKMLFEQLKPGEQAKMSDPSGRMAILTGTPQGTVIVYATPLNQPNRLHIYAPEVYKTLGAINVGPDNLLVGEEVLRVLGSIDEKTPNVGVSMLHYAQSKKTF